jgi:hypothetical protein
LNRKSGSLKPACSLPLKKAGGSPISIQGPMHPPAEEIVAYCYGQSPDWVINRVKAHIIGCPTCACLITALMSAVVRTSDVEMTDGSPA